MKNPAAIRLLVLVLRQTDGDFTRVLGRLLDDLGWDATHPSRAATQLTQVLGRLRDLDIVTDFVLDRVADRVTITINRTWFQDGG